MTDKLSENFLNQTSLGGFYTEIGQELYKLLPNGTFDTYSVLKWLL